MGGIQWGHQHDLGVIRHSLRGMPSPQHLDAGRGHQGKERLISPDELEVVEAGLGSGRIGHAIKEVERTGTGFHRIRRHQLVRNGPSFARILFGPSTGYDDS